MSENQDYSSSQNQTVKPPVGFVEMWVRIPKRKQWMTLSILIVTVLVYIGQLITNYFYQVDVPLTLFALNSALIFQGQFWRLVTVVLVHGSILHIGLNMLALFTLGRSLERFYGPWRLLIIYLLGALGGSLFHFYFSNQLAGGAATGVFALAAAQLVLFWRNRFLWGQENRRILLNFIGILGLNLVINLFPGLGGLSMLGGFLAGLAFAWFAGPRYNLVVSKEDPKLFDLVDRVENQTILQVTSVSMLVIGSLVALRYFSALS
jgi:rhomboid protease GluP